MDAVLERRSDLIAAKGRHCDGVVARETKLVELVLSSVVDVRVFELRVRGSGLGLEVWRLGFRVRV